MLFFLVGPIVKDWLFSGGFLNSGDPVGKDDSDYLAFKETTWSYNKFVYRSAFLCEPVPSLSAHSSLLYEDNK